MIVKIVQLPPLKVISFHSVNSTSPEKDAARKLNLFFNQNKICNNPTCFQVFGRNNPISIKDPAKRGYELLLTIPDDFAEDNQYNYFVLPENTYCVVTSSGIIRMQENWPNIIEWIKQNSDYSFGYPHDYDYDNSPSLELEHHINPMDTNVNTMLVDYYFPVKKKSI